MSRPQPGDAAFDLASTFVHLGNGSLATPVPDVAWSPEFLASYAERFADDGPEGRLVCITPQDSTWDSWERHPAGEEVVVQLTGRSTLVQEVDGEQHTVDLEPGHAMVNPTGVWHTADVHEPGIALFITPGLGTEHRPR